jgi:hypothetical protein
MSMQGAGVANSYRREDSYLECGSRAPAFSRRSRASPALMLEAWLRVPKAQAGCITKSWLLRGEQCLRLPVRLPRLFEKDAAERQEQVQLRNIPAHARTFDPCGGELLARALNRA